MTETSEVPRKRNFTVFAVESQNVFSEIVGLGLHADHARSVESIPSRDSAERCLILVDLDGIGDLANVVEKIKTKVPNAYIVAVSDSATPAGVVHAIKSGASDFLTTPLSRARLDELIALYVRDRVETSDYSPIAPAQECPVDTSLAGLAAYRGPVFLFGEPSVGKARLAEAIHSKSSSAPQPYIRFRCAKMVQTHPEHALFGYFRGAFVGAFESRTGVLKLVGNGTLALDDVAHLSLDVQSKIAKVFRTGEFRPIGDRGTTPFGARIVATGLKSPRTLAAEGVLAPEFAALFESCSVYLPPLRARREQLVSLSRKLLSELVGPSSVSLLTPELASAIQDYTWPGNLSELIDLIGQLSQTRNSRYVAEQLRARIVRSAEDLSGRTPSGANGKPKVMTAGMGTGTPSGF